jgi:hypothetical protein
MELLNPGSGSLPFSCQVMLSLLEYIVIVILVVVSLGGFATAVAWSFAIWFDHRS